MKQRRLWWAVCPLGALLLLSKQIGRWVREWVGGWVGGWAGGWVGGWMGSIFVEAALIPHSWGDITECKYVLRRKKTCKIQKGGGGGGGG